MSINCKSSNKEIKKGEKSLKQLRDSIEIIPNMLMLWDKDNNLIMANESSRRDQKKLGFDLKPGASRLEMVKNGVKKELDIYQHSEEDYIQSAQKAGFLLLSKKDWWNNNEDVPRLISFLFGKI